MSTPEKDVQLLTRAGLTKSQAYLYLALLKKGKANASTLSQQTRIARTEIYRILNELLEIGLVEKQLCIPCIYQAVSIKSGTQVLLTKNFAEYKENQKKVKELLKIEEIKEIPYEAEPNIMISKGKQNLLNTLKIAMKKAKRSIDVISSANRWCQVIEHLYNDFQECLYKEIKYRAILEESDFQNSFSNNVKDLLKKNNIELRISRKPFEINYAIFDNKKVIFNYNPLKSLNEGTTLWTNHHSFLAIFEEHFSTRWELAQTLEF